jgi:hypothetical protein
MRGSYWGVIFGYFFEAPFSLAPTTGDLLLIVWLRVLRAVLPNVPVFSVLKVHLTVIMATTAAGTRPAL